MSDLADEVATMAGVWGQTSTVLAEHRSAVQRCLVDRVHPLQLTAARITSEATLTRWVAGLTGSSAPGPSFARECLGKPDRRRAPEAGHVYFIRQVGGSPIKVGKSIDVRKRLESLQNSTPYPLELLALMRGGVRLEGALHRAFQSTRLHGEWFLETPELMLLVRFARGEQ